MQDESQLQDTASKLEAGSAERQEKARFGASFESVRFGSLGCWPRAHGV